MTGIRGASPLVGSRLRVHPAGGRPTEAERQPAEPPAVPLVRRSIGQVLRRERQQQARTLREVSAAARVSLGYLSEVERGQKEASSELLSAICGALHLPISYVLGEVSADLAVAEGLAPVRVHPSVRVGDVVAAA